MTTTLAIRSEQKRFWEQNQSHRRAPDHPAIRAIYEPRACFLRALVSDLKGPSILDVGCGTGAMTYHLNERFESVHGVDFSEAMLRENPLPRLVCGDAACLPFAPRSFDIVTCAHLLHHMPPGARLQAVREFARVASRWVVLYEPNRNNAAMLLFGLLKQAERMSVSFSRRYMVNLMSSAGLEVTSDRAECTILPNKTPTFLVRFARWCDRRPINYLGFYTRVVGRTVH